MHLLAMVKKNPSGIWSSFFFCFLGHLPSRKANVKDYHRLNW